MFDLIKLTLLYYFFKDTKFTWKKLIRMEKSKAPNTKKDDSIKRRKPLSLSKILNEDCVNLEIKFTTIVYVFCKCNLYMYIFMLFYNCQTSFANYLISSNVCMKMLTALVFCIYKLCGQHILNFLSLEKLRNFST